MDTSQPSSNMNENSGNNNSAVSNLPAERSAPEVIVVNETLPLLAMENTSLVNESSTTTSTEHNIVASVKPPTADRPADQQVNDQTPNDSKPPKEQQETISNKVKSNAISRSSSNDNNSVSSGVMCRICHCEETSEEYLIAPCFCSGTLRYVHQSCLQQWLKSTGMKSCELCKFEFIMQTKIRSFKNWEKLDMNNIERRKVLCAVSFHVVAILCVVWSLYVLIERTADEITKNQFEWAFWIKLVVVAIGFTGGAVFMYIQCKMYFQLCLRWRQYNRVIIIQPITEDYIKNAKKKQQLIQQQQQHQRQQQLLLQQQQQQQQQHQQQQQLSVTEDSSSFNFPVQLAKQANGKSNKVRASNSHAGTNVSNFMNNATSGESAVTNEPNNNNDIVVLNLIHNGLNMNG